jgi:hypothetical protein
MNLQQLVAEYGAANLRFFIPMSRLQYAGIIPGLAFRTSGQPEVAVECVVDESRYTVADGYKITLRALDPMYGQEHYYQIDLQGLLRHNPDTHRVYVLNIDGYQHL